MSAEAEVCRRLWVAVVARAAADLLAPSVYAVQPGGPARVVRRQAAAWLGGRDFARVCALAGLDAQSVAARLRRRQDEIAAGEVDYDALVVGTSAASGRRAEVA